MDFILVILQPFVTILTTLLRLYFYVVIVSAILSWVSPDPFNPVVRVIRNLTEPVFNKVRELIPFTNLGGIDLSPIVVLLGIEFLRMFLLRGMQWLSFQM